MSPGKPGSQRAFHGGFFIGTNIEPYGWDIPVENVLIALVGQSLGKQMLFNLHETALVSIDRVYHQKGFCVHVSLVNLVRMHTNIQACINGIHQIAANFR